MIALKSKKSHVRVVTGEDMIFRTDLSSTLMIVLPAMPFVSAVGWGWKKMEKKNLWRWLMIFPRWLHKARNTLRIRRTVKSEESSVAVRSPTAVSIAARL